MINAENTIADYSESYTYNKDGFMLTKSRTDNAYIFTKESSTNRLASLTYNGGIAQGFTYDEKGRLTDDNFSVVSNIKYNYQNLPISLASNGLNYEYGYNSGGERILKKDIASTTTDHYLRDYTGRTLAIYNYNTKSVKSVNIHGNGLVGKIDIDNDVATKYYYLKDHLGNIRQTIREDGTIMGSTDYYPYGEKIREWVNGMINRYKFTEKELDPETNYYNFGARNYNFKVARWNSVDQLDALYPRSSPYNYILNNPVSLDLVDWEAVQFDNDSKMIVTDVDKYINYLNHQINELQADNL